MIRTLLLLGCVLGAAAGASEARALAVLEGPEVAAPTRTPPLASIGFKRPGTHRGSGGFAKKFGAAHAFTGKRLGHGRVVARKAFAGQRFVPHRPFRTHAFLARKRSAGAGFVVADRFRKGTVIHGGRSNQLRLFRGTHSGHARVLARKHSFGPGFFAEQRFGHPGVVIRRVFIDSRPFGGKRVIVVETGSGRPHTFRSKRFGHGLFFSGRALPRSYPAGASRPSPDGLAYFRRAVERPGRQSFQF